MFPLLLSLLIFLTDPDISTIEAPVSFHGRVTAVKDGDTFKVLCNGREETVRLLHIDSPEKKQPFGNKAKQYASSLCFGRQVKVIGKEKDRYGRLLAEVYIGKDCVNKMMVGAGMAWHFKKYSRSLEYSTIEVKARKSRIGLWRDKDPVAPWEWRKNKRSKFVNKK